MRIHVHMLLAGPKFAVELAINRFAYNGQERIKTGQVIDNGRLRPLPQAIVACPALTCASILCSLRWLVSRDAL